MLGVFGKTPVSVAKERDLRVDGPVGFSCNRNPVPTSGDDRIVVLEGAFNWDEKVLNGNDGFP